MKLSNLLAFFNDRFQNALASIGYGLYVELDNQTPKAVKYWGAMRNNTRTLLPKKFCRVRDIINYFACTSIVPFKINLQGKYKKAFDSANTLLTCWQTYSQNIIILSNAVVIVLVGKEVFDMFTSGFNIDVNNYYLHEVSKTDSSKPDSNNGTKDIYLFKHKIGNTIRFIVNIVANQGDMRNFKNYFVPNSRILSELQQVVANSLKQSKTSKSNASS